MRTLGRYWCGACLAIGSVFLPTLEASAIDLRQITFTGNDNGVGAPDWSSNASRLAITYWSVDSTFPYQAYQWIAILGADGTGWLELPNQYLPGTWHGPLNSDPSWSPGGERIVFSGGDGLWIGGVAESLLTSIIVGGGEPAWSPDGSSIAYTGLGGIWIVPAAGGNAAPLTSGPDRSPAWSRDGMWIAFSSMRDGRWDLWIVSAQGGEPRRITDDAAMDTHPSWSPDGKLLVFSSDRSGNADLWTVRVSNGALSQVTTDPGTDLEPAWSPDGTRIAFTSDRAGSVNIWLASDLRTVNVAHTTWSEVKQIFR